MCALYGALIRCNKGASIELLIPDAVGSFSFAAPGVVTTWAGTASTHLTSATPVETVSVGCGASGDWGILSGQRPVHTFD